MHVADNARIENRKSSSGRKIGRMARILMKFGPKKSQRPKLFHENCSNETNRKFPKKSKNYQKNFRKILKMDISDVIKLIKY